MNEHSIQVAQALKYIELRYHLHTLNASEVETSVANNSPNLRARFKREVGFTLGKWISARRMQRARELLAATSSPVSDIAFSVGYDYHEVFCRAFKRFHGESPTEYRRRAVEIIKRDDQARDTTAR